MPSNQPAAGHLAVQPQYLSSQSSPVAKTSEPNRSRNYDPRKIHITDQPMTKANWYRHVNWLNVFLIVGIPYVYSLPLHPTLTPPYGPSLTLDLESMAAFKLSGPHYTGRPPYGPSHTTFVIILPLSRRAKSNSDAVRNWLGNHSWLPQTLGSYFLFGHRTPQNLLGCRWRRGRRGQCQMVGQRPSRSSVRLFPTLDPNNANRLHSRYTE